MESWTSREFFFLCQTILKLMNLIKLLFDSGLVGGGEGVAGGEDVFTRPKHGVLVTTKHVAMFHALLGFRAKFLIASSCSRCDT
jgi:hypothetical protein